MFNELMETDESAKPRVVTIGLEVHQHFLSNARPFAREILLHYLAYTDSKLYPGKPTRNTVRHHDNSHRPLHTKKQSKTFIQDRSNCWGCGFVSGRLTLSPRPIQVTFQPVICRCITSIHGTILYVFVVFYCTYNPALYSYFT